MVQAIAHRGKENKWVCGFGSMALYVGPSANKADDLAKDVNRGLAEFGQMRAERIEHKGRLQWCARIGTYIIKGFGNSANKADDFANEFNAVVASVPQPLAMMPGPTFEDNIRAAFAKDVSESGEMPAVPVPAGAPVYETDDGKGNRFEGDQP